MELLHLDRKLLLLLAASLMPACIIPIGPDWQDPPGEMNVAPQIIHETPSSKGPEVVATGPQAFTITVTDPNGDPLFFRWIANYDQPLLPSSRILNLETPDLPARGGGDPVTRDVTEVFDCYKLNDGLLHHRILAVVADRKFVSGGDSITVEQGGGTATVSWMLNLPCSSQPSQ